MIVTVLTQNSVETLYRFYGARHSTINIGYMIDFEIEYSQKTTIGRLKDVIHIGFSWIHDFNRLRIWQDFVKLFYPHLRDAKDIDSFYFDLLFNAQEKFKKQNPKRVVVESYAQLLEYEGRLHSEFVCFLCERSIDEENINLVRAYLPAHISCTHKLPLKKNSIKELFLNKSTLFLDDGEVENLYITLLEGL